MKQEILDDYQGLVRRKLRNLNNNLDLELARMKREWEAQGKPKSGKFAKEMVKAHTDFLKAALKAVFSATTKIMARHNVTFDYALKSRLVKLLDDNFYSISDTIEDRIRVNISLCGVDFIGGDGFSSSLRGDIARIKTWYNNRIITYSFEVNNRLGAA